MLLLNLILLIDVTFSTPTPHFTNNPVVVIRSRNPVREKTAGYQEQGYLSFFSVRATRPKPIVSSRANHPGNMKKAATEPPVQESNRLSRKCFSTAYANYN
jgi:hypothetical protein